MSTQTYAIRIESNETLMGELTALISVGPVCARCLAFRLGRRPTVVYATLQRISALVALTTEVDRCGRCLREAVVHTLV